MKINDYQKNRFAQNIIDHFGGDLTGKKITILGWAFKANTNDSRESAAISVSEKLFSNGATLEIYDPMVSEDTILNDIKNKWTKKWGDSEIETRIKILKSIDIIQGEYDAIAIITEWEEFKSFNWNKLHHNTKVFNGGKF